MTNREPRPHSTAAAELTLTLDDGEVYVREDGARDAPALQLIHGNASSSRWWDEMVPPADRPSPRHPDRPPRGTAGRPSRQTPATHSRTRHAGPARQWTGSASSGSSRSAIPAAPPPLPWPNDGRPGDGARTHQHRPAPGRLHVPPVALDPSPWPDVSDGVLRQITSAAFSRPGYQIPAKLLSSPTASGSAASSPRPVARARPECGRWRRSPAIRRHQAAR